MWGWYGRTPVRLACVELFRFHAARVPVAKQPTDARTLGTMLVIKQPYTKQCYCFILDSTHVSHPASEEVAARQNKIRSDHAFWHHFEKGSDEVLKKGRDVLYTHV